VEHAQPFHRPTLRRPTALAVALLLAVSLLVAGGLALAQRQHAARPAGATARRGPARPPTPLRQRSRISVLVLNGNGVSGAAGTAATKILARGYRHAIPSDAPTLDYVRSLVLYRPGWQREAERLGRDSRIPTVAPLDGRVAPAYDHVPLIVILGAK
jgi:hypothetical protein